MASEEDDKRPKTREDYLKEKEADARADLVRSMRGGYRGSPLSGMSADAEREAGEAREGGDDWVPGGEPPAPRGVYPLAFVMLIALCGLGYVILEFVL